MDINYEAIMTYIAEMYKEKKAKIEMEDKSLNKNYLLDNDEEYVKLLDVILSLMPHEYERIIKNDYFQERKVKWWQEFYSKSTYYRRKHEAVRLFVDCLSQ